jgi:hypothetical protein
MGQITPARERGIHAASAFELDNALKYLNPAFTVTLKRAEARGPLPRYTLRRDVTIPALPSRIRWHTVEHHANRDLQSEPLDQGKLPFSDLH